jgi:riboflavin transporter FmnP
MEEDRKMKTKWTTKQMTVLALMAAMATVLSLLIRFPIVPAVSFLNFEPKDIIIAIAGFIFGPFSAFIVSLMASVLELLFTGGNMFDVLMNVISTCTFVCTAAFIYKKLHTKNGALLGLIAGIAFQLAAMLLWNYVIDPIYYNMPREAVVAMLPAIGLFNVIKCSVNASVTLLVYKPVVTALRKAGLVKESQAPDTTRSFATVGLFVAATVLIFILGYNGII